MRADGSFSTSAFELAGPTRHDKSRHRFMTISLSLQSNRQVPFNWLREQALDLFVEQKVPAIVMLDQPTQFGGGLIAL
jgi:hypothetical protein